jgi:hypothetical protein
VARKRHLSWLLSVILVAAFVLGAESTAGASNGNGISVTFPSAPIPIRPGSRTDFQLKVRNDSMHALAVTVVERSVRLENNGHAVLGIAPDSTFGERTSVTPARFFLAAGQERRVRIKVQVPSRLAPNDYFVGFLVSPVVTGGQVRVLNDVGAFVILDVPGPRHQKLTATFVGLPSLSFSNGVSASIRVRSVGAADADFTSTIEVSGFVTPHPRVVELPPYLAPPGTDRTIPVHFSSWLGLGWYTVHATFVYNATNRRTAEAVIAKTVIVVSPYWFILPASIGLLTILLIRRRRVRRTRETSRLHSRSGRHSATRNQSRALRRTTGRERQREEVQAR